MTGETQPIFFLGSGRSGTAALARWLGSRRMLEIHHEYLCEHVQQLAALSYMGQLSSQQVALQLAQLHGVAVRLSRASFWADVSNKLSWLVRPLHQLFPSAKFVLVVRDGRKVVSSFYHKLNRECYEPESTQVLLQWLDDPAQFPCPPPEKRYWWAVPPPGHPLAEAFRQYDQFQRICFHWAEVHRVVLDGLTTIPREQKKVYQLETLVQSRAQSADLLGFLGLPEQTDDLLQLKRPHNVARPQDYPLTPQQQNVFHEIAGAMMKRLGYAGTSEYRMVYHPE